MNIKQLDAFLLIAQLKNFTKAAAQLDMSQPAVSFQIKALEEDLKVTLFERTDKKVLLTEAGRLLYPTAVLMVRQYNKIKAGIEDLREVKAGHLMLGASPVAGEWLLPHIIGGFREHYPAVTVSLQIGGSPQVAHWLKNREVDVGLLGTPVKAEAVECQPWVRDTLVVIVPPWHPLRGRESTLQDLTNETLIVREAGSGARLVLEQQFSHHNVTFDQFPNLLEFGSAQAVINAVRMGLGIGAVSRWAVEELLERGSLGEVLVGGVSLSYDLYLAWNRPENEGLASRTFRTFVNDEEIKERFVRGMKFFTQ